MVNVTFSEVIKNLDPSLLREAKQDVIEDGKSKLLRFNSLRICRVEKAADNQLALAVDEGVCHVLFSRKTMGGLQWLDPKTTSLVICSSQSDRPLSSLV